MHTDTYLETKTHISADMQTTRILWILHT